MCVHMYVTLFFLRFRFLIEATRSNPDHADFESLIESIQIGCKTICNLLARSAIHYESDMAASSLESGNLDAIDNTRRLYDKASAIIKNSLKFTGTASTVLCFCICGCMHACMHVCMYHIKL